MRERSPSALSIGTLRIASGAHFFTDVVFAGVLIFLVVWTFHGLIYRWKATRLSDATVERQLVGQRGRAQRLVGTGPAARPAADRQDRPEARLRPTACVAPAPAYSPREFSGGLPRAQGFRWP